MKRFIITLFCLTLCSCSEFWSSGNDNIPKNDEINQQVNKTASNEESAIADEKIPLEKFDLDLGANKNQQIASNVFRDVNSEIDRNVKTISVTVETDFEIDEYGTSEYRDVYIKSLVDNVTINDVILNRGNCNMNRLHKGTMPFNLVYGQRAWDRAWDNSSGRYCSVSEVEVKTNKGSFTFNF